MSKTKEMVRDIDEALSIGFCETEEKLAEGVCNYWLKKAYIDGLKAGIGITISTVKGKKTKSNDQYYQDWRRTK